MGIEQTVLTAIGSVGFPILVAWYVLTRMEKSLKEISAALTELRDVLTKVCERLNDK